MTLRGFVQRFGGMRFALRQTQKGRKIMKYKKTIKMSVAALLLMTGVAAAQADIIFTLGNDPLDDSDNVLFTDDSLSHSGSLIQGNFNGSGSGFIVDFTSISGNGNLLAPSGGQARVEGAAGNTPLGNISFGLEGGTFTGVILNPFSGSGLATLLVTELKWKYVYLFMGSRKR